MKRKDALGWIRMAGYHGDSHAFVRLYVENRVSYAAANAEWRRGEQMKKAGVKCDCWKCAQGVAA